MLIYQVTVKIDSSAVGEWLQWMLGEHLPEVMATGMFTEYRILKSLENGNETSSYVIQYQCPDKNKYDSYVEKYAQSLQEKHNNKFKGKFEASRILLETI